MIEFHGIASKDGTLRFPPAQEKLRMHWLIDCSGKSVTERLHVSGRAKSQSQVKTHFGLAVMMIREKMIELGWDICGVAPNKEMIHEILTKACMGVGPLGEIVRLSEQTVDQNIKTFENIRAWAATQLGLNIPNPDKDWRSKK